MREVREASRQCRRLDLGGGGVAVRGNPNPNIIYPGLGWKILATGGRIGPVKRTGRDEWPGAVGHLNQHATGSTLAQRPEMLCQRWACVGHVLQRIWVTCLYTGSASAQTGMLSRCWFSTTARIQTLAQLAHSIIYRFLPRKHKTLNRRRWPNMNPTLVQWLELTVQGALWRN